MKKPQLFLLHFAGGNCYSFQFLFALLNDFEIIPLELPGRGKRMKEDLLTDFDKAATDIYDQIVEKRNSNNFVIYGHSMGAYLGLRVSGMLEKVNMAPDYLIVSGNPGPGIKVAKNRYLLEEDKFLEEVKILGGISPLFFEDKELLDFFIPILRADFEIAEKNELKTEVAIKSPIFAMMGSQEEEIGKISNWAKFTRSHFNYQLFEGGHFFINNHAQRIARIIKDCDNHITLVKQQKQFSHEIL